MAAALALALALRLLDLGTPFDSSDQAELAVRVIEQPGYAWMAREVYGVLGTLIVKLVAGLVSLGAGRVTEVWWRAPVAVLGALQTPLTFAVLRRVGCGRAAAWTAAAFMAVLPVHVMTSRSPWGFEVLGVFFGTVALWALLDFFRRPAFVSGAAASVATGLYLISHVHIVPFLPALAVLAGVFGPGATPLGRLRGGIAVAARRLVWLVPVLFLPLYARPLVHALVHKPTRLGWYLPHHLSGFIQDTGWPLALLLGVAVLAGTVGKSARSPYTVLFVAWGAAYLAPVVFGSPPGITIARVYLLAGTSFWLMGAAVVLDRTRLLRRRAGLLVVAACFGLTLWGTVESIFGRDRGFDPALVRTVVGGVPPDPASKAAGYLVRRQVPGTVRILALHRSLEPPNLLYYFGRRLPWICRHVGDPPARESWLTRLVRPFQSGRAAPPECRPLLERRATEYAFYDLPLAGTIARFHELWDRVDLVVAEEAQRAAVESVGAFVPRVVLSSEGRSRLWLYARPHVPLAPLSADVRGLDDRWDREYAPRVRLW